MALNAMLPTIPVETQEKLVMGQLSRIQLYKHNQVRLTVRLDPEMISDLHLPNRPSASSPPPGLEPTGDFPWAG
jgi:hypothetical protein